MSGPVVVHVTKVSGISGSEAHLLTLLPALRERGLDARMLVLHEHEPGALDFVERLRAGGVPVDESRFAPARAPLVLAEIAGAIRRHRPAVLHTHLVHADLLALPLGRLLRVPVVMSTKHGFNEFRDRRAFAFVDRSIGRLARPHLAISAGLARYLATTEGFPESTFEVVHYGIDAGPPPTVMPPVEAHFGVVGRLVPIKGHRFLLEAVARLGPGIPGLRVEIAGSGPLEGELRVMASRLGVTDIVEFLGHVAPPWPVMERALAVVVPSLGEGFGMVALEAMARGRAVIATDVGGLPEIVEHGVTGLVVPRADPDALAAAMRELAGDPARSAAMGAAGRRCAETAFTLERCVERHVEVVRSALLTAR